MAWGGRWWTWEARLALAYSGLLLLLGAGINIVGPTISALSQQVHHDEEDLGIIFVTNGLVSGLTAPLGGYLVDHVAGHPLLAGAVCILTITFAIIPLCTTLVVLTMVYTLSGKLPHARIAFTVINIACTTFVTWVFHEKSGPWLNLTHASYGVGSILAPICVAGNRAVFGHALFAYPTVAVLAGTAAALMARLRSPKRPLDDDGDGEDDDGGEVRGGGDASSTELLAELEELNGSPHKQQRPRKLLWSIILLSLPLYALTAADFVFGTLLCQGAHNHRPASCLRAVGCDVGYGAWLATYASEINRPNADLLTSAYWLSFTAARLLAVPVAVYVGPGKILLGSLPLAIASQVLLLYFPSSEACLWVASVCFGAGLSTGVANSVALLRQHSMIFGSTVGVLVFASSIGRMLVPSTVALIATHTHLRMRALPLTMLAACTAQVLLVAAMLLLARRLSRAEVDEFEPASQPSQPEPCWRRVGQRSTQSPGLKDNKTGCDEDAAAPETASLLQSSGVGSPSSRTGRRVEL
eukprot:jgi/Chlat1/6830/Chrsp51S06518